MSQDKEILLNLDNLASTNAIKLMVVPKNLQTRTITEDNLENICSIYESKSIDDLEIKEFIRKIYTCMIDMKLDLGNLFDVRIGVLFYFNEILINKIYIDDSWKRKGFKGKNFSKINGNSYYFDGEISDYIRNMANTDKFRIITVSPYGG